MTKRVFLLLPAVAAILLAGCGSDDGSTASASASASASAAPSGTCEVVGGTDAERDAEVHVTLDEWAIEVDTDTVDAGVIEFDAENEGDEPHELVIVKGATPGQLKITDEGLDEDALPAGAEVLGEIEGFPGGDTCHGSFELAAGDYSLVCNIVEASEHGAHAHMGMVKAFTVS